MDPRATVEQFERIRRDCEFGVGMVQGVAKNSEYTGPCAKGFGERATAKHSVGFRRRPSYRGRLIHPRLAPSLRISLTTWVKISDIT